MSSTQSNLATAYEKVGRVDQALLLKRDVYYGLSRIKGDLHAKTLGAAFNYANSLERLKRFEEVKSLLGKTMPVARRVFGDSHDDTLRMRTLYAMALCNAKGATLDDLRKAVTTLEETERIARRVFGGEHPLTTGIEAELRDARAALEARETPPTSA